MKKMMKMDRRRERYPSLYTTSLKLKNIFYTVLFNILSNKDILVLIINKKYFFCLHSDCTHCEWPFSKLFIFYL